MCKYESERVCRCESERERTKLRAAGLLGGFVFDLNLLERLIGL